MPTLIELLRASAWPKPETKAKPEKMPASAPAPVQQDEAPHTMHATYGDDQDEQPRTRKAKP